MAKKGRISGGRVCVWSAAASAALPTSLLIAWITPLSTASAGEAESAGALEEVVVTARKREESLQDTPIAISAFSAAALERQQITSTEDLDQVAPNLQFASYG